MRRLVHLQQQLHCFDWLVLGMQAHELHFPITAIYKMNPSPSVFLDYMLWPLLKSTSWTDFVVVMGVG
jgi:hypothetical protein